MKIYRVTRNVGKVKILVSHHDGVKAHKDGSPFFDINTFKNEVHAKLFISGLASMGYVSL